MAGMFGVLTLCIVMAGAAAAAPAIDALSWTARGSEHITLVDITFSISGTDDPCWIALWGHDEFTRSHFAMRHFLEGDIADRTFAPGEHSLTWIASLDNGGRTSEHFKLYARVSDQERVAPGRYLVIDVSDGPSAEHYPVAYLDCIQVNPDAMRDRIGEFFDVTRDEFKTDKIVLRELPDGSYAGVYPVTQRQYEHVTGQTPSSFGGNPMRPVERVSWNAITGNGNYETGFIALLRQKTGLAEIDLPTSAAWEYACRAGATMHYNDYTLNNGLGSNAEADLDNLGWYSSNSSSRTHDVGGKQPNAWGLYDTHGNVWEWTVTPSGSSRVVRGGWSDSAIYCRAGRVYDHDPSNASFNDGFRLALPAVH